MTIGRVIAAVVPIKSFTSAKTRMSARLDPEQRACLARVSAERVLRAVALCPDFDWRIAVVEDEPASVMALQLEFEVLLRPDLVGQSATVDAGFDIARSRGADTVLTVSADCPLVRPRDLQDLLRPAAPVVVAVSDREGRGTNALRLSPPVGMRLHFGPDSLAQHRREAEALGTEFRVVDNARIRLDLDTGDDLDALD
ncbi:MAG: 2-phospho-L-lactate/phosphoenolpyruvate guanylyltransferase, partial [Chloroflexota bacterium]|nr:2-phospho-L-lactate/phosphoenolpyruvate guanylyltransferase [Chloroflexota bacterium]